MRRTSDRSSRNAFSRSLARRPRRLPTRSFRPEPAWLEERTLLSTVTWINPSGGDWDTPSNWSTDAIPGPADDVIINMPDITVTHSLPVSDSVNSLTVSSGDSTLDISNGSLALSAASSIAGSFTLSNATLSMAGDLTISGPTAWTGGTIGGSGTLSAQGGLTLGGSGAVTETLDAVTLDNAGAATLAGAGFYGLALESGAGVVNQAGASFDLQNEVYVTSDSSATFFTNAGSLSHTGSAGSTGEIREAFTQANTGTTSVQAGQLNMNVTGTISGSFTGAAGTTLYFGGIAAADFDAASSIATAGDVLFDSPTVTVDGSYDVTGSTDDAGADVTFDSDATIADLGSDLDLSFGASLDIQTGQSFTFNTMELDGLYGGPVTMTGAGAGTLTVTGAMTWVGGTISGFSALAIAGGATLSMGLDNGGYAETLDGVTLDNAGTATLAGIGIYSLEQESGAGVVNQTGGSFTLQDNVFVYSDGSATSFTNAGSLSHTGPAASTGEIREAFTQTATGTTSVQAGQLNMNVVGTMSGSYTGAAGTTLYFGGIAAAHFDAASSIVTAGNVLFDAPAVTEDGYYDVTGSTALNDPEADVTFASDATIADLGADLSISGGATLDIQTGQSIAIDTVEINQGTLTGASSGILTVTGAMTWVGGTISGLRALAIGTGATLSMGQDNNGYTETLDGITLDNAGTANLAGYEHYYGLALESGAGVVNQAGASFTLQDNVIVSTDGSATFFTNAGSVSHTGPAGSGEINAAFTNTGSVIVQQGGLSLRGTSSTVSTGTFTGAAGTNLTLIGQALAGSSVISSNGFVEVVNSVEAGSYSAAGGTYADSTSFTGPVVNLGPSLEVGRDGNSRTVSFAPASGGPVTLTTGSLTVDSDATLTGIDSFAADGPVTIDSDTTLAVPTVDAYGGLTIDIDTLLDGTVLNNHAVATWQLFSPGYNNVIDLESGATINNLAGASFAAIGTGVDNGNYNVIINQDGSAVGFNNAGSFTSSIPSTQVNVNVPFANSGSVVLEQGSLGLNDATNSGTVTALAGTTLGIGSYTQTAGSTILDGATINGGSLAIDAGSLVGSGTLNANVTNGGQVIPGGTGTSGTLTINGSYMQTASGVLDIDIGGTTTGSQYDQLAVSGAATLGGTLNVALINGFQPAVGNTFQILTFGTFSSNFATYSGLNLGGGLFLDPVFDATSLTLDIAQATSTALTSSANPSTYGQTVTFTATVSNTSTGGVGAPTGAVQFVIDGSAYEGPVALIPGSSTSTATITDAALNAFGSPHTISAVYTNSDGNFIGSTAPNFTQNVNKATLTVTANNATKVYGSANPAFTASYSGFVNNDTSSALSGSPSLTTTATTASPVGRYAITAVQGSLAAANYMFAFVNGTLTVTTLVGSIYVLDPTAGGALTLSGNAAINTAASLVVDSSASTAILASGNAKVTAASVLVQGSVSKSGNASVTKTGTPAATGDPLGALVEPTPPSYSGSAVAETLSGNATATINPGLYSQINVSGNAKLTLNAGVYVIAGGGVTASGNAVLTAPGVTFIIEGGGFNQSGNAIVNGAGVTIFNAGSKYPASGGSYGAITLSGNGNLSAPATGPYAGILVFQSRDNTQALTFSGNAILGITGTIYAEAAQLVESGNAQVGSAQNPISIVVDRLTISGNGIADGLTLDAPTGTTAYTPAQVRSAYGINSLAEDGTGQTMAIVDAYNDPNIVQALDTFDTQFGLTSIGPTLYQQYGPASSFLTVLNQYGQATSLPTTDPNGPGTDNWEVEEALDVEWAHAIAPGAKIILVEANSQSLSDLMAGVATAASQPGVSVVSMSWGFPEGQSVFASDEAAYDSVFTTPGVTFVASTGDYGAADPEYPAYSPNVVAVGGTSLALNADNSYNSETGWGYYSDALGASIGSGGGLSLYEPEPAYQQGIQSTGSRTTPDVSFVADPATGAWIADPYNLDPSNPFEIVGGTSLSAPAWAGLLALANQGRVAAGSSSLNGTSPTEVQQALYSLPQSNYNVITSGSNGYTAASGYNLVTGLGTPVANLLVPDLVAYQGPGTTYSGPTVGPLQDANLVSTGASTGSPIDVFSVFDSFMVTSNGGAVSHGLSPSVTAAGFSSVPTPVSLANASGGGTVVSAKEFLSTAPIAVSGAMSTVITPPAVPLLGTVTTVAPPSALLMPGSPGMPTIGARPVQRLTDPTEVGRCASSLERTIDEDPMPARDRVIDPADLRPAGLPAPVEAAPIVIVTDRLTAVWDNAIDAYVAGCDEPAWLADALAQAPDAAADPSASTVESTLLAGAAVALWGTWEVRSRRDDRRRRSYLRHIGLS
jgi:hypothetical protein